MLNSSLSALLVLSTLASSSSFSSSFSFLCTSSSSFFFYKTLKSLYTHAHSSWELQKRATGWIWPSSHRWLTRSQQFSNTDQKLSKNPWCIDKKCQKTETQLWFAHTYGANIPTMPIALLLGTELGTEAAETGLHKITVQQSQADNTRQKFCHYQIWETLVLAL